jgi:ribosomal protein S19
MIRINWKGPYINENISNTILDKKKEIFHGSRNVIITPNLVGFNFLIHNGKNLLKIKVTEEMVGHKFGEFSLTRKKFTYKKKKK